MAHSLFSRARKNKPGGGSPSSAGSPTTPESDSGSRPRATDFAMVQQRDAPSEQRRLLIETENAVAHPARGRSNARVTPMLIEGDADSGSCFVGNTSSEDARPLLANAFGSASPGGRSIDVDAMLPRGSGEKETPALELLEWAPNFANPRRMPAENDRKYSLHDFPLFFLIVALASFVLGGWCAIWAGHVRCALAPVLADQHHHTTQQPEQPKEREHATTSNPPETKTVVVHDCDHDKEPPDSPPPTKPMPDEKACAAVVKTATGDFRKRLDDATARLAREKKARLEEREEAKKSQFEKMDGVTRAAQLEVAKAQERVTEALDKARAAKEKEESALSAAKSAEEKAKGAQRQADEAKVREESIRTRLQGMQVGPPSADVSKVWHNQGPSDASPQGKYAYVLMAHEMHTSHPNHLWGVLALARQLSLLSEHGYPILLLTNVTQFPDGTDIKSLKALNVQVLRLKDVPPPHGLMDHKRWEIAWLKVQIWTLTDYQKLLWLDSDAIIYRSVDHLFDSSWMTSQRDDWHCRMTTTDICSGIMLVFPSLTDYQGILDYGSKKGTDWSKGDQLVIQNYFLSTNRAISVLPDLEATFGQCIGTVSTPYILPTREPVRGMWAMPSFVHKSGGWAEGSVHFYDVCFQPEVSRMLFTISGRNINVCHLNPLSRYWRTSFCEGASILDIAVPFVSAFCHDDCWVRGKSPDIPGVGGLVCGPIDASAPADWVSLAPGQPWEQLNPR